MPKPKPQPGKGQRKRGPKPVTMLQIVPKTRKQVGDNTKTSETRARFLEAYEKTFGNVSASCQYAGISRMTFYRWLESQTPVNVRFRAKLDRLKPDEAFADELESALVGRVRAMDTTAIIFGLKAKGRHRGGTDKPLETALINSAVLDKLMAQVNAVIEPTMPESEKQLWIRDIAANAGVPEDALMRRLKVLELSK